MHYHLCVFDRCAHESIAHSVQGGGGLGGGVEEDGDREQQPLPDGS